VGAGKGGSKKRRWGGGGELVGDRGQDGGVGLRWGEDNGNKEHECVVRSEGEAGEEGGRSREGGEGVEGEAGGGVGGRMGEEKARCGGGRKVERRRIRDIEQGGGGGGGRLWGGCGGRWGVGGSGEFVALGDDAWGG